MNSRERILTALKHGIPDCVPYMYSFIDTQLQEQIVGHSLDTYLWDLNIDPGIIVKDNQFPEYKLNYAIHPETARKLGLDAIGIRFPAHLFCVTRYGRGGHSVERGLLNSHDSIKKMRLPDVDDERIYSEAKDFTKKFHGEFAIFANIRLGASSTLMSMGYDNFSFLLHDDISLVYEVVDKYTNWMAKMTKNLSELGFDFMWAFDDIACNTGPMFSIDTWNDVFVPRLKKAADNIKCPWIYHSDGNLLPILDYMLPLGMSALHPLEPGVMDLDLLKAQYGKKLCLVGNIDIDYTLSQAPVEEVAPVVKERIEQLGPNGGYIIADSNSVPYFCKAENILAMSQAVKKYRNIYS
ncbi:MAG: uroporphyrinogen decarboxylase family protein [Planctomycetota bacterium]